MSDSDDDDDKYRRRRERRAKRNESKSEKRKRQPNQPSCGIIRYLCLVLFASTFSTVLIMLNIHLNQYSGKLILTFSTFVFKANLL